MKGMLIFEKMDRLPSDMLEEYFDWLEEPAVPKPLRRHGIVYQMINSGWGVAAICCLVSVSVLAGIIWAGRQAGAWMPGASTSATDTDVAMETEQATNEEAESTNETVIQVVYEENGVIYTANGDGTCYVSGVSEGLKGGVTIPPVTARGETVTAVGDRGFYASDVTSVILPEGLTMIGVRAFWGCLYLEEIVLPDTLTSLGECAFDGCTALETVTIPASLRYIPEGAFYGCYRLTTVHLCSGFGCIYENAFMDCTRLRRIYFHGTAEAWDKVDVESWGNTAVEDAIVSIVP